MNKELRRVPGYYWKDLVLKNEMDISGNEHSYTNEFLHGKQAMEKGAL